MRGEVPKILRVLANFRSLASRPRPGQQGYTILEVLVAGIVLAIAGVGVSLMFGTGQALVQNGGATRVAFQLAQQRLEEIRSGGFGTQNVSDTRAEASFVAVPGNPGYQRTTAITAVCPANFALAYNDGACPTSTVEAKRVVVTVRVVGLTVSQDPQTEPAVLQTVLTRR